eukprot:1152812-Pelagomonas_calceolata.AAC.1
MLQKVSHINRIVCNHAFPNVLYLFATEDMHDLDLRVAVDVEAMAKAARRALSKADVALIK